MHAHVVRCASQVDSTYSYSLDKVLPRLIAVSREAGEESNGLRAAGLKALAAMVNYATHYVQRLMYPCAVLGEYGV